jgi:cell division septation protein DedD
VLVGRGVQNARGGVTEAAGLESGSGGDADDDSTAAPASGEPTPVAGLSYPESLPARDGEPQTVAPGAARDLANTSAVPPAVAAPAAAPPPSVAAKAVPKAAEPPPAAPSAAPAPAEDGGFTVQVTALKNRPEADAIAQRLQARGYQAYVVAPGAGGQVIYKVRVGVNMQRQEADKVMRRLQNEEKFKPWITR